MKPQLGEHYRSEKTKVLMTITEVDEEMDRIGFQVADSGFFGAGQLSMWSHFSKDIDAKLITPEQFQTYLKTYKQDIAEQQRIEDERKVVHVDFKKGKQ